MASATKTKPVRELSCEIVSINKAVAQNLLKTTVFPRQRATDPINVHRLAGEMRRGWFVPGTPLFFATLPNGDMLRLNGTHSLNAVIETDSTIPFTYIYCPVDTFEQAAHLYSRFDIHKPRTWHDAYKAAGFEERVSFDKGWVAQFGSALRAILTRFENRASSLDMIDAYRSRELQLRIFEKYIPYAEGYIGALAASHGRRSTNWRRASVFGVGLELFRYQPSKAQDFFATASADSGLERDDPRKVLFEYLRYTTTYLTSDRRNTSFAVAQAWNAWYRDQEMTALRPTQMKEFQLAGTPWKKGYEPFTDFLEKVQITSGGVAYTSFTTGQRTEKTGEVTEVSQFVGDTK